MRWDYWPSESVKPFFRSHAICVADCSHSHTLVRGIVTYVHVRSSHVVCRVCWKFRMTTSDHGEVDPEHTARPAVGLELCEPDQRFLPSAMWGRIRGLLRGDSTKIPSFGDFSAQTFSLWSSLSDDLVTKLREGFAHREGGHMSGMLLAIAIQVGSISAVVASCCQCCLWDRTWSCFSGFLHGSSDFYPVVHGDWSVLESGDVYSWRAEGEH